jgi:hypothetical protein
MASFLILSEIIINVNAIRYVRPGFVKSRGGDDFGCTVWFIDSSEPHSFYDGDAERLLALLRDRSAIRAHNNEIKTDCVSQ